MKWSPPALGALSANNWKKVELLLTTTNNRKKQKNTHVHTEHVGM